jgi:electron transport complex protein RnfG
MSRVKNILYFLEQSWLLLVSSFFFGLLIALANSAWSPRIAANEKAKLDTLMTNLITQAESFDVAIDKLKISNEKGVTAEIDVYKALDDSGKTIGFTFVASGSGFADEIKLVIAADENCQKLFGYQVLKSNETPGFGDKIKDPFFSSQFVGAPAGSFELIRTGNAEIIDSQIVAISGATISSTAVVDIFNTYINAVKEKLKEKGLISNGK